MLVRDILYRKQRKRWSNNHNTSDTINYITSPEGLTAIQISHSMGGQEWYWVFTDHLGSITTLLRESDGQKFEMSYDACKVKLGFCECSETKTLVEPISYEARGREGNRRDPATWNNYTTTLPEFIIDRGYTGHEHLDEFGLINMNGRVYDPVIARFLSPDPYIQSPDVPQNYNGYAYCLNNPLKYTDPSGNAIDPVSLTVMALFTYFSTAYNNRDQATGKWQWNPLKWAGKDSPGLVIGISTNTSFTNTTFYSGVNWNNGMGGANFGYNTGSGFGYGFDPGNPGALYYPEMNYSKPEQNAVKSIDLIKNNFDPKSSFGPGAYAIPNIADFRIFLSSSNVNTPFKLFHGVRYYENSIFNDGSAVTLPPYGIWIGEGVFDSRVRRNIMTKYHEYGHWLQYQDKGLFYYYSTIAPYSAAHARLANQTGMPDRQYFSYWTEIDASSRAYIKLDYPKDWDLYNFPVNYLVKRYSILP